MKRSVYDSHQRGTQCNRSYFFKASEFFLSFKWKTSTTNLTVFSLTSVDAHNKTQKILYWSFVAHQTPPTVKSEPQKRSSWKPTSFEIKDFTFRELWQRKDGSAALIWTEKRNRSLNCRQTETAFWGRSCSRHQNSSGDCRSSMLFLTFLSVAGPSTTVSRSVLAGREYFCCHSESDPPDQRPCLTTFSGFHLEFTDVKPGSKSLDLWVKWS